MFHQTSGKLLSPQQRQPQNIQGPDQSKASGTTTYYQAFLLVKLTLPAGSFSVKSGETRWTRTERPSFGWRDLGNENTLQVVGCPPSTLGSVTLKIKASVRSAKHLLPFSRCLLSPAQLVRLAGCGLGGAELAGRARLGALLRPPSGRTGEVRRKSGGSGMDSLAVSFFLEVEDCDVVWATLLLGKKACVSGSVTGAGRVRGHPCVRSGLACIFIKSLGPRRMSVMFVTRNGS